jgi:hypothetical protein
MDENANNEINQENDEVLNTIIHKEKISDELVLPINSFKNIPDNEFRTREFKIKPAFKQIHNTTNELVYPPNKKKFNIDEITKPVELTKKLPDIVETRKSPVKNEKQYDMDKSENNRIVAKRDEIFNIITNSDKKQGMSDKPILFNTNDKEMYLESVKKNLENYNIKKQENMKNRKDLFSSFDEKIEKLKKRNKAQHQDEDNANI